MLQTIARFRSSFALLFSEQAAILDTDSRTENARSAMLHALSGIARNESMGSSRACADIARAADAQTLWYLRSDVLRLLSDFHGEQVALSQLDDITEMFRGMVSPSQMPDRRRFAR